MALSMRYSDKELRLGTMDKIKLHRLPMYPEIIVNLKSISIKIST